MDFKKTQMDIHSHNINMGWWDGIDPWNVSEQLAKLALVHTEISEACECCRDNDIEFRLGEKGKPEGLVVELADAVIRIMDICEVLNLNLEDAIVRKMEYNKTRPHRHGGRLA